MRPLAERKGLRFAVSAPETAAVKADRPFHEAKDDLIAKFEKDYLTDLVQRANGNLSQAARIAGLERKFLYKLLERSGLRQKSPSDDDAEYCFS